MVPEVSFAAFKQRQIPQMKIVGSNFPIAGRVDLQSDIEPRPAFAAKPTHVVIAPTEARPSPSFSASVTLHLSAGTQVVLMQASGGWVLIARDGKRLGYVEEKMLARLQ
jgi:hypothetical protein